MPDFSYAALTGRGANRGAPPVIATAPEAAAANTNADPGREADGVRAMFDLRSSPAVWYVLLVLGAAALAKSLGVVRGG